MMLNKLNEGFDFFESNDSLTNSGFDLPKYKIGDLVITKPNGLSIHSEKMPLVSHLTKLFFRKEELEKNRYTIIEFARHDSNHDWFVKITVRDGDSEWISEDAVTNQVLPNYKPRKIVRTLESKKHYPYRFKTEQDFIDEYGNNWLYDETIDWNDVNGMDYLFGQDYPFFVTDGQVLPELRNTNVDAHYSKWVISWDMLTPNIIKSPSYKPKNIKRMLEMNNTKEEATGIIVYIKKEKLDDLIVTLKNLDYIDDTIGNPSITDNMLFMIYFKDKKYKLYFTELTIEDTINVISRNLDTNIFNSVYNYVYDYDKEEVIIKDILNNDTLIKKIPNYKPRTIIRTLENKRILSFSEKMGNIILENVDYTKFKSTIKRKLFDSKYTMIAIKLYDEKDRKEIVDLLTKYSLFNDDEINRIGELDMGDPKLIFLSLKDHDNWDRGIIYYSSDINQFNNIKGYKDNVYPVLLTPDYFEDDLIKLVNILPNYLPKKIKRL